VLLFRFHQQTEANDLKLTLRASSKFAQHCLRTWRQPMRRLVIHASSKRLRFIVIIGGGLALFDRAQLAPLKMQKPQPRR
jgi:hypothetical protein